MFRFVFVLLSLLAGPALAAGYAEHPGYAAFEARMVKEHGFNAQSCGMLVNYRYVLQEVEANHEAYINAHSVVTSNGFRKLLNERRELQASAVAERS